MAAAGVPTGAVMAMVGVDGNSRAQIRSVLLAAPLERAVPFERRVIHFGTGFHRTARVGLRSAAMRYSDDYHRTPSSAHAVYVSASGNEPRLLLASSAEGTAPLERRVIHFGTGFPRTAMMGLRSAAAGYSDDYHRTPSRRHAVYASKSHHEPRFLRSSSTEAVSKVLKLRHMCSSTDGANTSKEPMPEPTSRWAKFLALIIKLKGNIGLLLLLSISLWIGFLAAKKDPNSIATNIVDVCDKSHKVYNITSKGFLIIAEMLKGGSK